MRAVGAGAGAGGGGSGSCPALVTGEGDPESESVFAMDHLPLPPSQAATLPFILYPDEVGGVVVGCRWSEYSTVTAHQTGLAGVLLGLVLSEEALPL